MPLSMPRLKALGGVIARISSILEAENSEEEKRIALVRETKWVHEDIASFETQLNAERETIRQKVLEAKRLLEQGQETFANAQRIREPKERGHAEFDAAMKLGDACILLTSKEKGHNCILTDYLNRRSSLAFSAAERMRARGYGDVALPVLELKYRAETILEDRQYRAMEELLTGGSGAEKDRKNSSLWRRILNLLSSSLKNLPRISERVQFSGNRTLHMKIYADARLREHHIERVRTALVESIGPWLESAGREIYPQGCEYLITAFNRRAKEALSASGDEIAREWLSRTREALIRAFTDNDMLFFVNDTLCQVRIYTEIEARSVRDTSPHWDTLSTENTYLIGIPMLNMFLFYLLCESADDTIPTEVLTPLLQYLKSTGNVYFREAPQYERSYSIYNIVLHELQHAAGKQQISQQTEFERRVISTWGKQIERRMLDIYMGQFSDQREMVIHLGIVQLLRFYGTCRVEAPSLMREACAADERGNHATVELIDLGLGRKTGNLPGQTPERIVPFLNKVISHVAGQSDPSDMGMIYSWLADQQYWAGRLTSGILLLDECRRTRTDVVLVRQEDLQRLFAAFPALAPALTGASAAPVPHGIESDLIAALRSGDMAPLKGELRRLDIPWSGLQQLPDVEATGDKFQLFKPPMQVMLDTIRKIERCNELRYFDMYGDACFRLKLQEQILSIRQVHEIHQVWLAHYNEALKKEGFLEVVSQ